VTEGFGGLGNASGDDDGFWARVRVDNRPRPTPPPDRPFAYFQWNYGYGVWEQVVSEAAGNEGVIAAYIGPTIAAQGIEAPSGGETPKSDSTEGESPVAESDAP
jgi:hypothetical protein